MLRAAGCCGASACSRHTTAKPAAQVAAGCCTAVAADTSRYSKSSSRPPAFTRETAQNPESSKHISAP